MVYYPPSVKSIHALIATEMINAALLRFQLSGLHMQLVVGEGIIDLLGISLGSIFLLVLISSQGSCP